ncbi:carotenoid biosynthesis protein [Candidatus Poribacteria bacterium]|nr:carotenoid biosynthesis protein [Candidatus Poribacteria bacterium]
MKISKILPFIPIIFWLLVLLAMPFIESSLGERPFYISIILSVLIQAWVVLSLLLQSNGVRYTLKVAIIIISISWVIEAIGVYTGLPFGEYSYTHRLKPQLAGVPLLIPFAWLMMLPPSWAVASKLSGQKRGKKFIILSGLAFAVWDLYLDPQMVRWDLWKWEQPGIYYGIPLINFVGWFATSMIITAVTKPSKLPEGMLSLIYVLTWIMEFFGLMIFWELRGPAIFGFIGMGLFIVPAYYLSWKRDR